MNMRGVSLFEMKFGRNSNLARNLTPDTREDAESQNNLVMNFGALADLSTCASRDEPASRPVLAIVRMPRQIGDPMPSALSRGHRVHAAPTGGKMPS
jgi:hypothetical protein